MANELLEGGLVNFFCFVDVDCAAYVSVETRVEETGRILQRRALGNNGSMRSIPGRDPELPVTNDGFRDTPCYMIRLH